MGIPALRPQRAEAARRLARAVAQLRRRHAVRQRPRPDPLRRFDRGITHFDLANNYGPPPGAAEENFGRILSGDLRAGAMS